METDAGPKTKDGSPPPKAGDSGAMDSMRPTSGKSDGGNDSTHAATISVTFVKEGVFTTAVYEYGKKESLQNAAHLTTLEVKLEDGQVLKFSNLLLNVFSGDRLTLHCEDRHALATMRVTKNTTTAFNVNVCVSRRGQGPIAFTTTLSLDATSVGSDNPVTYSSQHIVRRTHDPSEVFPLKYGLDPKPLDANAITWVDNCCTRMREQFDVDGKGSGELFDQQLRDARKARLSCYSDDSKFLSHLHEIGEKHYSPQTSLNMLLDSVSRHPSPNVVIHWIRSSPNGSESKLNNYFESQVGAGAINLRSPI